MSHDTKRVYPFVHEWKLYKWKSGEKVGTCKRLPFKD